MARLGNGIRDDRRRCYIVRKFVSFLLLYQISKKDVQDSKS